MKRRRIPALILDGGARIGDSWRGRYDRLRLNSSRWDSTLPGRRYPSGTPVFPDRDTVADYVEDYAREFGFDVRGTTTVRQVERVLDGFALDTDTGTFRTSYVVLATGFAHTPRLPRWPGIADFAVPVVHSSQYRSPEPYRGRDVLVVGAGCSGLEIAHELSASGARRVRLSVRRPPTVILRSPVGSTVASAVHHLPVRWGDAVLRAVSRKDVGDLTPYGLPPAREGAFTLLRERHVVPTIADPEAVDAVRAGRIEVVPGVRDVEGSIVVLSDGRRLAVDVVVAATGFTTGLDSLVGHLDVLDAHGLPTPNAEHAAPGLHFVGYSARPAPVGHFGREGARVAAAIAAAMAKSKVAATG